MKYSIKSIERGEGSIGRYMSERVLMYRWKRHVEACYTMPRRTREVWQWSWQPILKVSAPKLLYSTVFGVYLSLQPFRYGGMAPPLTQMISRVRNWRFGI
jgi:hypothetical protein